jgi:hypothetical protein
MADRRKQAVTAVDRVLVLLERLDGLDDTWRESSGGWTTSTREAWLQRFGDIRSRLLGGDDDFEHEASHLLRSLDDDGIVGGTVSSAAADLQWRLERLRDQRSKSAADGK